MEWLKQRLKSFAIHLSLWVAIIVISLSCLSSTSVSLNPIEIKFGTEDLPVKIQDHQIQIMNPNTRFNC